MLLVPDLGADKTWIFEKRGGEWHRTGSLAYTPGDGPRHVVYHGEDKTRRDSMNRFSNKFRYRSVYSV